MLSKEDKLELSIRISGVGSESDPNEIDSLARNLRREVAKLDVSSAELASGTAPRGAKGLPGVELGTLLIATVPVVMPKLIELFASWISARRAANTIRLKVTVRQQSFEIELAADAHSIENARKALASFLEQIETEPSPKPP